MDTTQLIVAGNRKILDILDRLNVIADSDCAILLIGETGVGKELFAEYIHRISNRRNYPLVKVSLSTLPPTLIESELFGYEKGAFTNSFQERKGQFELANNGTIFLDDIDDFPIELQSKLLRVLETGEIKRIGGQKSIPLDIRLITSSKIDLSEIVAQGKFRVDLFYRINVVPIHIPPLRERVDDIPLLVDYFLKQYGPEKFIKISEAALTALKEYSWPGNVRELKNVIKRIVLFADGEITLENLPEEIRGEKTLNLFLKSCMNCFKKKNLSYDDVMKCIEYHLLYNALEEAKGNYSHAARNLRMSLSTFRDKCRKYGIKHPTDSQNLTD